MNRSPERLGPKLCGEDDCAALTDELYSLARRYRVKGIPSDRSRLIDTLGNIALEFFHRSNESAKLRATERDAAHLIQVIEGAAKRLSEALSALDEYPGNRQHLVSEIGKTAHELLASANEKTATAADDSELVKDFSFTTWRAEQADAPDATSAVTLLNADADRYLDRARREIEVIRRSARTLAADYQSPDPARRKSRPFAALFGTGMNPDQWLVREALSALFLHHFGVRLRATHKRVAGVSTRGGFGIEAIQLVLAKFGAKPSHGGETYSPETIRNLLKPPKKQPV